MPTITEIIVLINANKFFSSFLLKTEIDNSELPITKIGTSELKNITAVEISASISIVSNKNATLLKPIER